MAITYTLDRENECMYTRAEGLLTLEELEAHLDVEEADRALGYAEVFDARGARTDMSSADIRRLVDRARKARAAGIVLGPTAVIADNDVMFGMARMYAMLAEFEHAPVEVFRDPKPAHEWLRTFSPPCPPKPRTRGTA